jgi:hypothetical protein
MQNRKSKSNYSKQRKQRNQRNQRNKKTSKYAVQSGGVSTACVVDYATSGRELMHPSNIHNTNPQASLDLDNKFMQYGGPVPLGSNIVQGGGASKCGDEGVGTGKMKTDTFKQYMDKLNTSLDVDNQQQGGGFTTDPSEIIAGNPVYRGYDDCCPPAVVGGKLIFSKTPDTPVYGLGAVQSGGRDRRDKRDKRRGGKSRKSSNKNNKTRSRSRKSVQRGGDWVRPFNSVPAAYADAFNGPMGVFKYPDDMKTRAFDETQPNYSVNAI